MATSRGRGGFLLSTANLVGTAGAALAAGLGAALVAALHLAGPGAVAAVAVAALGGYGLGVALTPGPRNAPEPARAARAWTAPELRDRVEHLGSRARTLDPAVASVLAETVEDLRQILSRWDVVSRAPTTAYEVAGAVVDFIPNALDAYERIPADLRDRTRRGRPAPTRTLIDQLQVLHTHLESIRDAAYERDITALESHGRFITTKYAVSPLDLDRPSNSHP